MPAKSINARTKVVKIAEIDIQSPWRGNFLPKRILIAKAQRGRNKITREASV